MEVSVQKSEPCALLKTGIGNVEGAGAGKPGSSFRNRHVKNKHGEVISMILFTTKTCKGFVNSGK